MLKCTKSIHPGVQSLWEFHRAGDPARVTDDHDGCGAAIRVAPVGILYRSRCLDEIVAGAREASISTHGGTFALAASAATAAAVSAAIDGAGADEILDLAELAADRAEAARSGSMETAFSLAIRMIVADLRRAPTLNAAEIANRYFPSTPLAIVPVAIALATVVDSAQSAILLAANIGGDADSVASIAGAICGARYPESVNDDWYRVVETVNNHRLADLGDALARVRSLRKP
jgi:ADP-ribosylglycohydrolase